MSVSLETGLKELGQELPKLNEVLSPSNTLLTGSAVINGEGNDLDVVMLVDYLPGSVKHLELSYDGWELCGDESYESKGMFVAYRKGNLNIILCADSEYYSRWEVARRLCSALRANFGLATRDVRVLVHQIIVDGEYNA